MFKKVSNTNSFCINSIIQKDKKKILSLVINNINYKLLKLNNLFTNFYYVNFKYTSSKVKKINALKKNTKTLINFYKKIIKIYIVKFKRMHKKKSNSLYARNFRKKVLIYKFNNK